MPLLNFSASSLKIRSQPIQPSITLLPKCFSDYKTALKVQPDKTNTVPGERPGRHLQKVSFKFLESTASQTAIRIALEGGSSRFAPARSFTPLHPPASQNPKEMDVAFRTPRMHQISFRYTVESGTTPKPPSSRQCARTNTPLLKIHKILLPQTFQLQKTRDQCNAL